MARRRGNCACFSPCYSRRGERRLLRARLGNFWSRNPSPLHDRAGFVQPIVFGVLTRPDCSSVVRRAVEEWKSADADKEQEVDINGWFRLGAAAIATLLALPNDAARADEGGVSFWIPGFFGSLAAVPAAASHAPLIPRLRGKTPVTGLQSDRYCAVSFTPSRPASSCTNCQATRPERDPRVVDHSSASRSRASSSILMSKWLQ